MVQITDDDRYTQNQRELLCGLLKKLILKNGAKKIDSVEIPLELINSVGSFVGSVYDVFKCQSTITRIDLRFWLNIGDVYERKTL